MIARIAKERENWWSEVKRCEENHEKRKEYTCKKEKFAESHQITWEKKKITEKIYLAVLIVLGCIHVIIQ